MDLQINHVCKEITSPAQPMALRLSSQLMYGTVLAMDRQSSSLHSDVTNLRNRLNFAPLAPRSIDLPQRRVLRHSLVLEDVAVLPSFPALPGMPFLEDIGIPELNLPDLLITPDVSWRFDDDDELGDLDMSFDDNGLLTDNLNIDDFVVDNIQHFDIPQVLTPGTPRTPLHTPLHSSPFLGPENENHVIEDLDTILEASRAPPARKRVRAATWDDEISLRMADIREFRDNYLDNMEAQKVEKRPRKKRRQGQFAQWKAGVDENDPILLLEGEIKELLTPPVVQRPRRVQEPEVARAATPGPATPGSIELARRGSAMSSPWSETGEARLLGSSGFLGSRTPGSGRARHSRRGVSRSGSFGDIDLLDEFPDPYFSDMPEGEYNMLSGTHEAQEFLFHLMSVCQGKTSFETIVPSLLSEGVPNDRATAATSFAKALDLATKGVVKLSGGGKPSEVFVELT